MNYKEIRELIELIRDTDVAEIEIERAGTRIRLRRERGKPPKVEAAVERVAPSPSVPEEREGFPALSGKEEEAGVVRSPLVGTFYRAPAPESKPFVEIGDHIAKGQVLCIVEAMKLMNEIEMEYPGTVREVLADNGQPVEYGQPLFRVDPDA